MEYKYVVISFNYPEYDEGATFDKVVGIYDDKEVADQVAKDGYGLCHVESVPYHKA